MHITTDIPDHAGVIQTLGRGFALVNCILILSGVVPPFPHMTRVRYQLEPAGEEDWKLAHRVLRDGWGDCEDLVFWTLAGLWTTGEDEGAKFEVVRTGENKLHAVVRRSDGSIEDPSLDLMEEQARGVR